MRRTRPRIEPFWAEIAADWPGDEPIDWRCFTEHLAFSAMYDAPRTKAERERVSKALEVCRRMDRNYIGYRGRASNRDQQTEQGTITREQLENAFAESTKRLKAVLGDVPDTDRKEPIQ